MLREIFTIISLEKSYPEILIYVMKTEMENNMSEIRKESEKYPSSAEMMDNISFISGM